MSPEPGDADNVRETIRLAAADRSLMKRRKKLASFTAATFADTGVELHLAGHLIGRDRIDGTSPFGHGSDETVAVSLLLRIATELISASADLFSDGRAYAAAALLRQMVEIEYLAWAIETRDSDGERWLRSDRSEREAFFTPRKLRRASEGKFRGEDYGYHCEFGGHPVPGSSMLLTDTSIIAQLLLADLLGHCGRIWDHFAGWARGTLHGGPILRRHPEMLERFSAWKTADPLAALPAPE